MLRTTLRELETKSLLVATIEESYIARNDEKGEEKGDTDGSEKRTSEREGTEGLGTFRAWVEAQTRDDSRHRGVRTENGVGRTGTGTRQRRNTNRLDVDGGVGVGSDMAEASHLPEVAKEMKYP